MDSSRHAASPVNSLTWQVTFGKFTTSIPDNNWRSIFIGEGIMTCARTTSRRS